MIRTVNPNPKAKQELLDAAAALITAQGFAATTVDQICMRAKLTKGSFFHYFDSKEDLGKEVVKKFCGDSLDQFKACCCPTKESDPLVRVLDLADHLGQSVNKSTMGCLLGALSQELSDSHPEIRRICGQGFLEWAKVIQKDLDAAIKIHKPKKSINSKHVAQFFVSTFEGSQILSKVHQNPGITVNNMRLLKKYIQVMFE